MARQQKQQADMWSDESKKADIENVNAMLADVAKQRITIEEAFEYRTDGGIRIALPSEPSKMELEEARDAIQEEIVNRDATYRFSKFFYCRPPDGAWAFNKVLKDLWKAPVGKPIRGFFGGTPPRMYSVKVSPTEEVNVPWGELYFSPWETTFELDADVDPDYGLGFTVNAYGKKKYEPVITGFFMVLERYVKENSIYAGKCMKGVTGERPEFYDPYKVNRKIVAYSDQNYWDLMTQVWGLIKHADLIREANAGYDVWEVNDDGEYVLGEDGEKIPVLDEDGNQISEQTHIDLSNNVMLHGDNGGGKTLACAITAQYCLEYGHTFVQAEWNEPLSQVLRFVQAINRPAVVVIEDVDNLFKRRGAMDALLDEFDGMRSKGLEVTLLMTSNHPDELPKSMLGGHRINHTILIGGLDEPGTKRLIDSHVPASQRKDLDYAALSTAFEGMMPAFMVRSLEDVVKFNLISTGKLGMKLRTEDFVRAANSLRPAVEMHQMATDRPTQPDLVVALTAALRPMIESALQAHVVDLNDGEIMIRS
jgi:ATPase family associated with various cellular activities (AAA)